MNEEKKIRVLVAKPGLDGHERGAWVLAYGLRDAGFEVIYTGLRQTPEQIATAAIQEDVSVVGLSVLSGAHLSLTKDTIKQIESQGRKDMMFLVGGVIPAGDIPKLEEMGVARVFTSGSTITEIAEFIRLQVS